MKEKLIHIGKYHPRHKREKILLLRERAPTHYVWYEDSGGAEVETEVEAPSVREAIRLASKEWKRMAFRTINCGFRYTLPERDEHGVNALFCEMAASYSTPNGVYHDEKLGHNCHVQFASNEALDIWQELKNTDRL